MAHAERNRAPTAGRPLPAPPEPVRWRLPYQPLLRSGDLQTVAARYWPRTLDEARFPTARRLFQTEPDTRVLAKVNRQPGDGPAPERPTVVVLHGLTACDHAPYMLSTATSALRLGFDCVRLNMRNCGGTEHLCNTLYHSGLTSDLRSVVEALAPRPLFLIGWSMGGNVALKLAGEWGENPPRHVRGLCAISPPIRLDLCSRNIGRPRNFVYEQRFLWQLRAALRRKAVAVPGLFAGLAAKRPSSIWEFDELVTAPAFGFDGAADYYRRCSAAGFVGDIQVPALVLQSRDDPFIPFEAFSEPALHDNPWLTLRDTRRGGHVAFLARGRQRFWAEAQALHFFEAILEATERQPLPAVAA